MTELRISDAELQRLVATALIGRLRTAGFHTLPSMTERCSICFPVSLELAGYVTVERHDDGTWSFQQELDLDLAERTRDVERYHASAVYSRGNASCR